MTSQEAQGDAAVKRHKNKMLQLYYNPADGTYDCAVTVQAADKDAVPVRRFYRDVSWASLERFFAVSQGYRTAYSDKETGRW